MVQSAMTNCRLVRRLRTGTLYNWGNTERMTWGIVSPVSCCQVPAGCCVANYGRTNNDSECAHSSERESELEE